MNQRDLELRLQDLFEGRLEGEEFENLQDFLRNDAAARQTYRDYLHLHHALQFRSKGVDLLNVIPMDEVNKRRQRKTLQRAGFAAVALLVIGATILTLIMVRTPDPTLTFRTSPGANYHLKHSKSGEETPEGLVLEPGSRLVLEVGTIELQFGTGVRGIIRGPADLTLQREDLLDLQNGTAWFEVPAKAVGFKVSTPDLVLIDLGTEFGILSEPNFLDEVHVFDGKVEVLHRRGLKKQERLGAGQARFAGPGGRWKKIPVRRDHFLDELPTRELKPAVIETRDFSNILLAYVDDVSDSDLLHGLRPKTSGWRLKNKASPLELTDGLHGVDFGKIPGDEVQGAWTTVGATAEYHLGTGANGLGYDLTSIQSIADWNGAGFGNQSWTVEVKPVGEEFRILHTVNYHPLTSQRLDGGGATKVVLTDRSGKLARRIEVIRFTASHIANSVGNAFVWREVDVFGETAK
ncbi:MAG: hypothetical protein ABF391_17995 [Akkermansiaceae bacterium]|jgi:ferric-dicitrate binding protein FerR (iron transport regulator)